MSDHLRSLTLILGKMSWPHFIYTYLSVQNKCEVTYFEFGAEKNSEWRNKILEKMVHDVIRCNSPCLTMVDCGEGGQVLVQAINNASHLSMHTSDNELQ